MTRHVRQTDAARICAIYNHYVEHSTITFEESAVPVAEMERRIAEVTDSSLPWIVWEDHGEIIGYAYAAPWKGRCAYRYSVESTVYLDHSHTGHGVGTRLYSALIDAVTARGMHAVIGGIAQPNAASEAIHQRLGFEKVAHFPEVGYKFDRWIDVAYWQLLLEPNDWTERIAGVR